MVGNGGGGCKYVGDGLTSIGRMHEDHTHTTVRSSYTVYIFPSMCVCVRLLTSSSAKYKLILQSSVSYTYTYSYGRKVAAYRRR